MINFYPEDMTLILGYLDVNVLSQEECRLIERVDIRDDGQLASLLRGWMREKFNSFDEKNRREMLTLLRQSEHWGERELGPVFSQIALPSGQVIEDIPRFMSALRKEFISDNSGFDSPVR